MADSENSQNPLDKNQQHPLDAVDLFSPEQARALRDHWIETVEQFLAATVILEGRQGMARLLAVSEPALQEIIEELSRLVPPQTRSEMTAPCPGGALGVILTDRQKQEYGTVEDEDDS